MFSPVFSTACYVAVVLLHEKRSFAARTSWSDALYKCSVTRRFHASGLNLKRKSHLESKISNLDSNIFFLFGTNSAVSPLYELQEGGT